MGDLAAARAEEVARTVTDGLGGRGIFGVELFVRGDEVLFSEVSPRPHDTGMVTLASQALSEFALHVRAILGLPIPTDGDGRCRCWGRRRARSCSGRPSWASTTRPATAGPATRWGSTRRSSCGCSAGPYTAGPAARGRAGAGRGRRRGPQAGDRRGRAGAGRGLRPPEPLHGGAAVRADPAQPDFEQAASQNGALAVWPQPQRVARTSARVACRRTARSPARLAARSCCRGGGPSIGWSGCSAAPSARSRCRAPLGQRAMTVSGLVDAAGVRGWIHGRLAVSKTDRQALLTQRAACRQQAPSKVTVVVVAET